jgi:hypothetical protein
LVAQPAAARVDVARLQRAAKGAHHPTGGSRNDVVDRCRMRLAEAGGIDLVVFSDRAVDVERHGMLFAGQVGEPTRRLLPFDSRFGRLDDVSHARYGFLIEGEPPSIEVGVRNPSLKALGRLAAAFGVCSGKLFEE